MKPSPLPALLLAIAVCAACSPVEDPPPTDAGGSDAALTDTDADDAGVAGAGADETGRGADTDIPEGWIRHETAAFSFLAPSDLVDERVRGIDSLVGSLSCPELAVTFDHGFYSDSSFAGRRDRPELGIETLELDGHAAELACWDDDDVAEGRPLACSVYAPSVGPADSELPMDVRLQFTVRFSDPALRPAVRGLLRSIRWR